MQEHYGLKRPMTVTDVCNWVKQYLAKDIIANIFNESIARDKIISTCIAMLIRDVQINHIVQVFVQSHPELSPRWDRPQDRGRIDPQGLHYT
jgi:hypothetical protein